MTEPSPAHGATSRARGLLSGALRVAVTTLAIIVCVIASVGVFVSDSEVPGTDELAPSVRAVLGFVLALGAAVALVWRHEHPLIVAGVALVPPLLLVADSMAALFALAAVAATRRDRVLWGLTLLAFVATTLAWYRDSRLAGETSFLRFVFTPEGAAEPVEISMFAVVLLSAVMTAVPLGIGLWRGTRRDLRRQAATEQQLLDEVTRQDERTRIAREMHDVLGHRLSLLSLQAGALEVSSSGTSDGGGDAAAAQTVRVTARQSLEDLRQVIGVLREGHALGEQPGDEARGQRSRPTLPELPELIADSRAAGLAVNATVLLDSPGEAPAALAAAIYRIIQESLTNVLRHAPGSTAELSARGAPGAGVTIDVRNPAPSAEPGEGFAGSGTGLTGISERAAVLGGTAETGPTEGGTFRVLVWLPWAAPGNDRGSS